MKKTKPNAVKVDTAAKQKAENNITIVNCAIFIYALLYASIASMKDSPVTIEGAVSLRYILIYCGVIGFMAIAGFAAYRSNKSLLKYSFMCLFVSISSFSTLRCYKWGTVLTWLSLGLAFLFTCVYAYITDKNLYYSNKKVRIAFRVTVSVVYTVILLVLILAFFKVI